MPWSSHKNNICEASKLITFLEPRDCKVSEWSSWGPCSKTCGIGETLRTRVIEQHPAHGGRHCPPLRDYKWCVECPKNRTRVEKLTKKTILQMTNQRLWNLGLSSFRCGSARNCNKGYFSWWSWTIWRNCQSKYRYFNIKI